MKWALKEWLAAERGVSNASQLQRLIKERTGKTLSLPTVITIYNGEIASLKIETIQTVVNAIQCNLGEFFDVTPDPRLAVHARELPRQAPETEDLRKGMELFFTDAKGEAAKHFERHLEQYPDDPVPRMMLVECNLLAGDASRAVEDCEKVLELAPNTARAHYLLGRAYLMTGRPADAIVPFERAHELYADDADNTRSTLTNLAFAYSGAGQHKRGLRLARKLLNEYPNSVKTAFTYFHILKQSGSSPRKVEDEMNRLYATRPQLFFQVEALGRNPNLSLLIE